MRASYHNEKFGFRFVGLTPEQMDRFTTGPHDFLVESGRSDVAYVELQGTEDLSSLYLFLKEEDLAPGVFRVWLSLVSSMDHDGLSAPQFIVDLIKSTNCALESLFTCCGGDDEDEDSEDGRGDDDIVDREDL